MTTFKCEFCGNEKMISGQLRYYAYKRKTKSEQKIVYFCSHKCMREAEKERGDEFVR